MTALMVLLAVGFAYSLGAHYTGACMGMPHALGVVSARRALLLMAPLALLGATLASHAVERTVGGQLLERPGLSSAGLVIVLGLAFALTGMFNRIRLPTSTIQILVFTEIGTGLAARIGVRWGTVGRLAVVWLTAPLAAAALGYLLTRALDHLPALPGRTGSRPAKPGGRMDGHAQPVPSSGAVVGAALLGVGALAAFTMGGNDVANATGPLVGARLFSPLIAGLVGGIALAAGVVTWGRPLLHRVAFDVVDVDRTMATAAQLVQATVVLTAVGFGFFTSMNQALVAALTGAGAARGRHTVHAQTLRGIVVGWVLGPTSAITVAYALAQLVRVLTGALSRG